jgi:tetratricopeptide (TPR) repeat protein
MDGCFKILMDEIHKYEGTINQFTGDGVMALFGAPLAHEDHAQRACHAALAIQKALTLYGEKLKADCTIDFKMRIGLNSGPVVVGAIGDDLRMDYTAIGDTINLASRMQSSAAPGTVLVSSHTHRLAKDFFTFSSLGAIPVKGKEEPQDAFILVSPGEVKTRIDASAVAGLTPFVGRVKEMETLKEALDKARSGQGQVVGIVGEAGVGKSRVILEMKRLFPEIPMLEGHCLHYGGSMAYLPVLDILRSYFEIKEGERPFLVTKKMREKLSSLDESLLSPLQDLLSLDTPSEWRVLDPRAKKERIFEALRDLLIRESQVRPLVLVIEDLHWIDKTSEEFLDYFIGWLANARILLILLYRSEYTHRWGNKSYYTSVRIDQLPLSTSAELVQSILSEGEMVPELRHLILSKAAGNPLFMEELTHSLLENGTIGKKDHHYVLTKRASDIQIPDSVQGIIAARMDRLEESLKRIMQVASVIGREFAFRILQSITEMREELKGHLLNLQGLEFIYEKNLFPELEYIFKHALTQEVAYNSLLIARRKEIHGKIGRAIEDLYPERLEEFYEMLAYHYSKSNDPAKGVEYGQKAASRTASLYAYGEAARLLEEALTTQEALDPQDRGRRCDLLLLLGEVLTEAGEVRSALDAVLPEAFGIAEAMGDKARASEVCQRAVTTLRYAAVASMATWGAPQTAQWVERADRYAEPGTLARVRADGVRGDMCYTRGLATGQLTVMNEGLQAFDRALDLARRLDDPETLWETATGWILWSRTPHRFGQRLQLANELSGRSREGVPVRTVGGGLMAMGWVFLEHTMRERVEECFSELRVLAQRTGQAHLLLYVLWADALVAVLDGRLEEAVEISRQIQVRGNELNLSEYAAAEELVCGFTPLLLLGRVDEAMDLRRRSPVRTPGYGPEAEVISFLDNVISARRGLSTEEDSTWAFTDMIFLDSAVRVRHREAVEFLFRRLIVAAPFAEATSAPTCFARHLGAAAAFVGRPEEARAYYVQAIDVAGRLRFRPEIALTRLELAELLLAHYSGEKAEAREHLDFAIGELREMKMQPALERALKQRETLKA